MRGRESSVIGIFIEALGLEAMKYGYDYRSPDYIQSALDGQDEWTGADHLVHVNNSFGIIEFKSSEKSIADENRKNSRKVLCEELIPRVRMRILHDKCHFICWANSGSGNMEWDVYRFRTCNKKVFTSSTILPDGPYGDGPYPFSEFVREFFESSSSMALPIDDFEDYLKFVMQDTSGTEKSDLALYIRDPDKRELAMKPFESVRKAYDWLRDRKLQLTNVAGSTPKPGGRG
ncbi:hypothetical protein [Azospirillum sp. sgz301742]